MVWGDTEKPWWDIAFLLITPSVTAGCKRVFDLVTVWAHPCQAHYTTLAEVACKLMLLMYGSADWVYAFIQLKEALSHAPLSSMGHISAITDGAPSMDACRQLHQLLVCKLLQYKDLVVCPEGLNGQMVASQFTFKDLPLWDTAVPGTPAHKPQLMVVDLRSMQPEGVATTIQTPNSTPVLSPSSRQCWAFWLHHCSNQPAAHGCYGVTAASFPHHPSCCILAQHTKETATICSSGAPPAAKELEDPFRPEGMYSITSVPIATFTTTIPIMMQMSPQVHIPAGALSFTHITPQILQLTLPKTPKITSLPFITWPQAPT